MLVVSELGISGDLRKSLFYWNIKNKDRFVCVDGSLESG